MTLKRAFDPVVDPRTRLLILGSLPGDTSLAACQYYAHPRNAFWRLVGDVIDVDLVALPYRERLDALQAARIGLWDVIASAVRPGSLDAAIRNPEAADLKRLVAGLPERDQCSATTHDGRRCRLSAEIGSDVCHMHSPANAEAVARRVAAMHAARDEKIGAAA